MASSVHKMLGIDMSNRYVLASMTKTNLDIVGYECIFFTFLCTLIGLSTFLPVTPWTGKPVEATSQFRIGFLALAMSCFVFAIVIPRVKEARNRSWAAPLAMLMFIVIVMAMSMWITLIDFHATRSLLVYVCALVLVFGLIFLPPVVTLFVVLICTAVMMWAVVPFRTESSFYGLSLIVYAFLVMLVSSSNYQTRVRLVLANQAASEASLHDALTGAKNRRALESDIAQFVGGPLFILIGDIDKFKFYNDSFGHATGDELLCQSVKSMANAFGKDRVYRYGGDEFVAIMCDATEQQFQDAVRAWRDEAAEGQDGEGSIHPTTSGGYAFGTPETKAEFRDMLHLADKCLYDAKQAGRNRVIGAAYDGAAKSDFAAHVEKTGE